MLVPILCLFLWLILWTIAIYKFRIDEEDNQLPSKVFLLVTAPLWHLIVFLGWGISGYIKRDWNDLAD